MTTVTPTSVASATGPRRSAKRSKGERLVPFISAAIAVAVAVVVLPSALRPPQDQPTTSGAFSPDAPPDPKQQSLFASFNSAKSGTAAGVDEIPTTTTLPGTPPPPPPGVTTTVPAKKKAASACPFGFGTPPRQVESVYAPPCAPAFVGSNGGATAPGVTPTEINQCFLMELTGTTSNGRIPSPPAPGASAAARTYGVFEQYFNSRLQLYGRQLRFYYSAGDGSKTGDENERARAAQAEESFHCFSAIQETQPASSDELARRKIFTFTLAQTPESYFAAHDPYLWSFSPTADQATRLGSEYACKRLVGKPPIYTDNKPPLIDQTKPRKWGIVVYSLPAYDNQTEKIKKAFQACGADVVATVEYNLTGSQSGTTGLSTAMTQLKAAGATTVAYFGDLISAAVMTEAATSNDYYPEWFLPGFGGVDTGHVARQAYDTKQWKHAFGFSFYEITQPDQETECYKAYHEIDPSGQPDAGICTYMWGDMIQLFGAMQQSGAALTPQSMKAALLRQPPLKPTIPYTMAGGYSATDHTYPDYGAEIWYSLTALGSDGQPGTYCFTNGGKRYTYGQWPQEDPKGLFNECTNLAPAARG